jgi:N utilization substance protein B
MHIYYSYLQNNDDINSQKVWNNLEQSLNKSYELYISLHCLLIQICDYAYDRIEIKKNKYLPTQEDLKPNTKFIDNFIFESIRKEKTIKKILANNKYNWSDCNEIIKDIWNKIEKSEFYQSYMNNSDFNQKDDVKIINSIINEIIINNERIDEYIEEKSVFWNDELEFLLGNIINSIGKIKNNDNVYSLLPIFKNEDDEIFARELITKCVAHTIAYDEIISASLKKWELERIAFLDNIILHLALTEIIEMPDIPISVTINEWLDISKCYSTEKSSKFINGVLDKIYQDLKNERKIYK